MTYIVSRPGGRWEIRETHRTAAGPRSRTLTSFRVLTPEVAEKAIERSSRSLTAWELQKMATEAGALLGTREVDRLARSLLSRKAAGEMPRPGLARALLDALASSSAERRDEREQGGRVGDRDDEAAGERLEEVLGLAEALPYAPQADPGYPTIAARIGESHDKAAA